METSHNGNLVPSSITPENLFDIQIREIDEDLEMFDKHPNILGKMVKAFNENINSLSIWNSPNKGRGTRKATENLVGGVIYLELNFATHLISSNPNPTSSKRKWKKQAHTKALETKQNKTKKKKQEQQQQSSPICGKWVGVNHLELPSKHILVSKDDGSSSNSMVEAEH